MLITDHARPTLAEAVESSAYAWGVSWLPIELEPAELRCGPAVRPGFGACHRCFVRRRDQHDRSPVPRRVRERHGSGSGDAPAPHPGRARVTGYAPHHVGMAVALARAAVHDLFSAPPESETTATRVRSVNLADGRTARHHVVAVDQCPRAAARHAAARTHHMADLRAADRRRTGGELTRMPNGDVLTAEQTGAAALRDPQLSAALGTGTAAAAPRRGRAADRGGPGGRRAARAPGVPRQSRHRTAAPAASAAGREPGPRRARRGAGADAARRLQGPLAAVDVRSHRGLPAAPRSPAGRTPGPRCPPNSPTTSPGWATPPAPTATGSRGALRLAAARVALFGSGPAAAALAAGNWRRPRT
ncbi:TOMM precursor leader peptide-binding protein [Streptomyces sp. GKU 257-1]|nr:TOMM precursor leader peptide-binding protein [Streptomyces sp. GKU 257-1]